MPRPNLKTYELTSYEESVAYLQAGLDKIALRMKRVKSITYTKQNRANCRWIDCNKLRAKELEYFTKVVPEFFGEYTRIMRAFPIESGTGIKLDGLTKLRIFHRRVVYTKRDRAGYRNEHYDFPDMMDVPTLYGWDTRAARVLIASRVCWLEKRQRECKNQYPAEGRYANRLVDEEAIQKALSEDRQWIMDWAIPVHLELHMLMMAVWDITREIAHVDHTFQLLTQLKGPDKLVDVQDVTKPCTSYKRLLKSGNTACDICFSDFGPDFNEEKQIEPAVLSRCRHVFGRECLQKWMNNHHTCPKCRQSLFEIERGLPSTALPLYRWLLDIKGEIAGYDGRIDSYFTQPPLDVYGANMITLLNRLAVIVIALSNLRSAVDKLLWGEEVD